MPGKEQTCQICDRPIAGEPFTLSALDGIRAQGCSETNTEPYNG